MNGQALGSPRGNVSTYYGSIMAESHAFEITLGGNKYVGYVDNPGDRIVSVKDTYGGTNKLFLEFLPRFQIKVELCNTNDHADWAGARLMS